MFAIFTKEINTFFSSAIGYLVIAVFLILNGLFLWVFQGNFNVFDYGFADLSAFFQLAPWIFIFLIPAITMRSFSEEKRMGTLELLLTKPISFTELVLGKFFGSLVLVIISLLPTLLYIATIYTLGQSSGNIDIGSTIGSYLGLIFLAAAYCAIGIFVSVVTENQIVAFILAVLLCFLFYFGFEGISTLSFLSDISLFIQSIGMKAHFESIGRGVMDTRDLIYFISVAGFFILLTTFYIKKDQKS